MAARSSWSGAITFAGFPIGVKAYNVHKSPSKDSFKSLCECHRAPIAQPKTCSVSGDAVTETLKGHEASKDSFVVVDMGEAAPSSAALEPEKIVSVASLPLELASGTYRLVASDAANEKSVAILYRSLRKLDAAYVTHLTMRAGSRDALTVIYAADDGLAAATLPHLTELNDIPSGEGVTGVEISDAETAMFEQAINTLYGGVQSFSHEAFASAYHQRRDAAIEAALKGEKVVAPAAAPAPVVPDLMAALSASLAAAKPAPELAVAA